MAVPTFRRGSPNRPRFSGVNASSVHARGLRAWVLPEAGGFLAYKFGSDNFDVVHNAMTIVDSAMGRAFSFTGASNSYLSIEGIFGFAVATPAPFTLAAWFYVTVPTNGAIMAFGYASDGSAVGIGTGDMDTTGADLIGLDQGSAWNPTGYAIVSGWHHLVYAGDSGTADYYLDGSFVANTGWGNSGPNSGPSVWKLWLGNEGNTTIRNLPCLITDVRLYHGKMTDAQARSLWEPSRRWDLFSRAPRRVWLDVGITAATGNPWAAYAQQ